MKKNFMRSVFFCVAILSTMQLHSQGYIIITNGVVFNFGGFYSPAEIDVLHNPGNPNSAGSYTGFELKGAGKTPPTIYTNTFLFNPVLDVGVRTFLLASNTAFSLQPILSQSFTELSYPNTYVFTNGVPFYLGLYTGNQNFYPPDGIYTDPLFGWVKLVNNQGTIQLLDSVLEYGGAGIYIGTQNIIQAVPEPSLLAFAGLGAAALMFCRRKK